MSANAIATLSHRIRSRARARQARDLIYSEGLTVAAVARRLGCDKSSLGRAIKQLEASKR